MSSELPRGRMLFGALIALVLTVLPMPFPPWGDLIRPSFLILTVLYWAIAAPRAGGVGLGWFSGLMLDVFEGPVLGEHALVLALAAYIAAREHQRIRSKPLFQQSLIILVILAFYEGLVLLIDGYTGHPLTSPLRWIHCVTGALIWAPVATLLAQGRRV
jgi:rod shape-determining protein MreD